MKSLIVTLKMPTNSYAFHASMEKGYHTTDEERRPGIITLYANFAQDHVEHSKKKGNVQKISREKIERQMLSEIDKAKFPIEYKMSWYHAILVSLSFDAFWKGISKRWKLPKSCTRRFTPDENLYEYDAPTDLDEAEEGAEDEMDHEAEDEAEDDVEDEIHSAIHNNAIPTTNNFPPVISHTPTLVTDHESRSSSSDSDSDWSSRSGTRRKWTKLTEENKLAPHPQRQIPAICRECGNTARPCWCDQKNDDGDNVSDGATERNSQHGGHELTTLANPLDGLRGHCDYPSAASGVVHGLTDNEGEHSAYEESSLSKNKSKAKTPTTAYSYPRAAPDAMNSRALQEEDDSSYEDTPSNRKAKTKSKSKAKSTATSTVEGAAKPKGVSKNKSTPKKKLQTAAQLKTAAAKTQEPAAPKTKKAAAKKAAPKATSAITTPLPASTPNNERAHLPTPSSDSGTTTLHTPTSNKIQVEAATVPMRDEAAQKITAASSSGLKRMLELYPNDYDDSHFPVSKKVKAGAPALTPAPVTAPATAPATAPVPTDADAHGELKKLKASGSGKKVVKWKPIEEEWDGTLRGFGNY